MPTLFFHLRIGLRPRLSSSFVLLCLLGTLGALMQGCTAARATRFYTEAEDETRINASFDIDRASFHSNFHLSNVEVSISDSSFEVLERTRVSSANMPRNDDLVQEVIAYLDHEFKNTVASEPTSPSGRMVCSLIYSSAKFEPLSVVGAVLHVASLGVLALTGLPFSTQRAYMALGVEIYDSHENLIAAYKSQPRFPSFYYVTYEPGQFEPKPLPLKSDYRAYAAAYWGFSAWGSAMTEMNFPLSRAARLGAARRAFLNVREQIMRDAEMLNVKLAAAP